MHDIRLIRDNPAGFDAALAKRGLAPMSSQILAIDESRRTKITASETALADRNAASKLVGAAKAKGDDAEFERLRALVADKKAEIATLEDEAKGEDQRLQDLLATIPNLPFDTVPVGADESENVEMHTWGTPRTLDFKPVEHFELAAVQGGMDFELAAKLSGSRFVVMSGAVARVHRALAQFMIDTHTTENGLTEVNTPVLVRDEAMYNTGQLPKFAGDSFFSASMNARGKIFRGAIENHTSKQDVTDLAEGTSSLIDIIERILDRAPTVEDYWLIPTSEVTLTNLVAGEMMDEATLPRRFTAHSLCFRSEAGSAGRDTSGMLRQHQFEKVEMVSVTRPEDSLAELDRMTKCAEGILERLELPYRTVMLCTGDIGFGARQTHDIEVWLPGQDTYREISSCSVCGDFQARRMNARFRRSGEKKPEYVHTLNGSGLAVGRCLIAVLENGQQADGSVDLPKALHPWLGGKTKIGADGVMV